MGSVVPGKGTVEGIEFRVAVGREIHAETAVGLYRDTQERRSRLVIQHALGHGRFERFQVFIRRAALYQNIFQVIEPVLVIPEIMLNRTRVH